MNRLLFVCVISLVIVLGCRPTGKRAMPAEGQNDPFSSPVLVTGVRAIPSDFHMKISFGSRIPDKPKDCIIEIFHNGTVLYRENSVLEYPQVFDIAESYRIGLTELYDIYMSLRKNKFFELRQYILDDSVNTDYVKIEVSGDNVSNSVFKSVNMARVEPHFDYICLKVNQYLPVGSEVDAHYLREYAPYPKLLAEVMEKKSGSDYAISLYQKELETAAVDERWLIYYSLAYISILKEERENAEHYFHLLEASKGHLGAKIKLRKILWPPKPLETTTEELPPEKPLQEDTGSK